MSVFLLRVHERNVSRCTHVGFAPNFNFSLLVRARLVTCRLGHTYRVRATYQVRIPLDEDPANSRVTRCEKLAIMAVTRPLRQLDRQASSESMHVHGNQKCLFLSLCLCLVVCLSVSLSPTNRSVASRLVPFPFLALSRAFVHVYHCHVDHVVSIMSCRSCR